MTWLSVGLGTGIGAAYTLASYATARFALRRCTQSRFLAAFLGGMAVRMAAALALITLVLVSVPVRTPIFIATFLAAFLIGGVTEVARLHREAPVRRHDVRRHDE